MSLATRCTSCGTVFRVVQDQLKVSEGWVRCGRCNEVFNALEGLFDLERDAPTEWSEPLAAATHQTEHAWSAQADPDEPDRSDPSLVDKIDAQLLSPRRSGFGALPGLAAADRRQAEFADARFDTDLPADVAADLSFGPDVLPKAPGAEDEAVDAPEFVRRADQQVRWRSSRARTMLFIVWALLGFGLTLQVGHHFRDRIAARWPPSQPVLAVWCGLFGCTIGAPRRIEDISVESTALTRAATTPDAFRLSVVLRNRAGMIAAMPWIDLSLTDVSGQLVARRALSPQDFRAASPALAATSETSLQLLLSAGSSRVSGYTVEVFYP
jgi:predicted Zn finger-like uncharacterized protein